MVVSYIDVLYYYILPLFNSVTFFTRKFVDYQLWRIALKIHKFSYFYLMEDISLVLALARSMNKQRYSTNTTGAAVAPIQSEIYNLFSKNPPFNIKSGLNHSVLSKKFYC